MVMCQHMHCAPPEESARGFGKASKAGGLDSCNVLHGAELDSIVSSKRCTFVVRAAC